MRSCYHDSCGRTSFHIFAYTHTHTHTHTHIIMVFGSALNFLHKGRSPCGCIQIYANVCRHMYWCVVSSMQWKMTVANVAYKATDVELCFYASGALTLLLCAYTCIVHTQICPHRYLHLRASCTRFLCLHACHAHSAPA